MAFVMNAGNGPVDVVPVDMIGVTETAETTTVISKNGSHVLTF